MARSHVRPIERMEPTTMGAEQGSQFYNENLTRHLKPLEESDWLTLYETTAELLPEIGTGTRIVDVGCGTGRFAALLWRMAHRSYWGVDFARVRVEAARAYVDGYDFETLDVYSDEFKAQCRGDDTYVILEVLEHLKHDRELIESIPAGASVVFSVPNYDAQAHVRFFADLDAVKGRYGDLLDINDHREVIQNEATNRVIWVCRSERR